MSRYRRTSSVGAMLKELNWEPLASHRRTARLVLFHKIHYGLVAINMLLELKHNSGPTRTENSLAYHIPASSVDYQKNLFFYRTVRDWNCRLSVQYSLNNSGVMYLYELYLRYSTSLVKGSRPFRKEPETFISILISTTSHLCSMHLEPVGTSPAGGSKNRNPRNPRNPSKFTNSNLFKRLYRF